MTLLAATVMLVLQTAPQVQQTQQTQGVKASIEGFVVRAGTNEPIARARITATRTSGPGGAPIQQLGSPNIVPVTTDSQGRFVIKDLDAGSYLLIAQRNGFARQPYGERAPGRPGSPLNLVAGQALKDLVFRLIPAGAISGRVTDATGEPLAGITIQIVRPLYDQTGKRTFQPISSARTNDRGEYRAYWITPGRYYVNAIPGPSPFDGLPRSLNSNEVVEPGYVLTYYPGTTDPSASVPIEVSPGAELSTIDFTLAQQQLFRIRGRVFDARTGQFPRNANVSISPRNASAGFFIPATPNYNRADGTFELRNVPRGSYWLHAISFTDPGPGPAIEIPRNSAHVAIDVSNADVENVVLAFTPGFSIKGRVDLDGASLTTLPDVERTRVFLAPVEPMPLGIPPQQIKKDGTFTLDYVQPGDYRISITPMPPDAYIKSARLGQTDVSSGISISEPVSDSLEILLSTKGGQVDGRVVDKDQRPMQAIQAVLIPDQQRDRRDLYRFGTSDQNGQFRMRAIAPGDYKLFAWDDLEQGAYNDPDFVRKYEALATPVKVSESGKLSVEVKVISAN